MRSEYCGNVTKEHLGKDVSICGWVHRRRDHGGVIFLDIRDLEGICQAVIDPSNDEAFSLADKCRSEFVIQIKGTGKTKTFTVRKMSGTVGIERIFPINLPSIKKIELNKKGKVRRSRIYYFKELRGKKARIKEEKK